ncbi:MAG: pyridoxal phosphate-dependent aminotransferase [Geothermobacteraceae bacterium]
MPIADKIQSFIDRASWIRKMFEEGARLREEFGAENVYDFTLGNPTVEPPPAFHEQLRRLASDPEPGMHRYMPNAGYPETRRAVAERLSRESGLDVRAEQIVMTCGAGGALNVVLKTLINPGDEVIILNPYFVEYKFYIDNHGGVPVEVSTRADFQLDLEAIGAAVTPKTCAVIVNSPNNPTGVIYPADDLRELDALLKRAGARHGRDIVVISDEPYARIAYDGLRVPSVFACVDNAVVVTSHSKDLALPGERIGFLAASPKLADLDAFMAGAVFCNRVLGFVNAPALAQRLVAGLQDASVPVSPYQEKRDLLYDNLTRLGFRMIKPGGAFYLFPESPLKDDVEFVRRAQEHRILLVPGSGFGAPGYFRIAYCIDRSIIERSLPAWRALADDLGMGGS